MDFTVSEERVMGVRFWCRVVVVVVVWVLCETVAVVGAAADTTKVATLTPPLTGAMPGLLAASGGVVVVGEQVSSLSGSTLGAVDVFTTDRQGLWASSGPAATLTDPAGVDSGVLASSVEIDGDVIVIGAVGPDGYVDSLLVYARPSDGWSGVIAPTATLTTSTGAHLHGVSVSGRTIAAGGSDGAIYVYEESTTGWSGTMTQSAQLSEPGVSLQPNPIVHDRAVYVSRADPLGADAVFTEPAAGWAGSVTPSGSLITSGGPSPRPDQLAFSGSLAAATSSTGLGLEVFRVPAGSATGRPTALAYVGQQAPGAPNQLLFSSKLAVDWYDDEGDPMSPVSTTIAALTRPARGWHGVLSFGKPFVQRSVTCCRAPVDAVALSGQTVFVEASSGTIEVLKISGSEGQEAPRPQARDAVVRGLLSGRPRISLNVVSASELASVSITLPHGITISHNQTTLRRAISVAGLRTTGLRVTVHRRTLDLSYVAGGFGGGRLLIRGSVLRVSRALRAAAQRNLRSVRLALRLAFHDSSGATQPIQKHLQIAN
jgi:hypothetical protein